MLEALDEDDLDDLLGLYEHLHREDAPIAPATARERWSEILSMPGHTVYGLRHGEDLIGSCTLQVIPNLTRGGRPYALMENVVVRSDHRGRSVGTNMVRAALAQAWEAGCYKVMVLTGADNQHTRHFYDRAGFDGSAKRGYVAKPRPDSR